MKKIILKEDCNEKYNFKNMNIATILEKIPFDKNLILNVYYYGSHLWGYASTDSDVDLIVVIKNRTKNSNFKQCLHVDKFDMQIYDEDEFTQALSTCKFFPLLTQFYSKCKLQEKRIFKLDKKMVNLKKSISDEINRDIFFADKLYKKKQIEKATKTLRHSIRMANIAVQIMKNEEIAICSQDELLKLNYEKGIDTLKQILNKFL